jgi:hypothetical protein
MNERDIKGLFCGLSEAARIIGLSEVAIRYHADRGHIEATRDPANRRLLLRESVLAFARRRQAQARGGHDDHVGDPDAETCWNARSAPS